ncbi:hypothetical protein ACF1AO_16995 [Streptomyces longwoodensis]|uniref:hypothetical protein n=1 Tax=Streptomyces longwoodensis TaxID=68231 RepID=UPI0036FF6F38
MLVYVSEVIWREECPSFSWTTLMSCVPGEQGQGGGEVAQVVEAGRWQAGQLDHAGEASGGPVGVQRLAVLVRPHPAVLDVGVSPLLALLLLLRTKGGEVVRRLQAQGQGANAVGLWRFSVKLVRHLDDLLGDP